MFGNASSLWRSQSSQSQIAGFISSESIHETLSKMRFKQAWNFLVGHIVWNTSSPHVEANYFSCRLTSFYAICTMFLLFQIQNQLLHFPCLKRSPNYLIIFKYIYISDHQICLPNSEYPHYMHLICLQSSTI